MSMHRSQAIRQGDALIAFEKTLISFAFSLRSNDREEFMTFTRRQLCSIFPAALIPAFVPFSEALDEKAVLPSSMFPFEKLVASKSHDAEIRSILKGKLATGESVEVHETTLSPGGMPHPPHRHVHSEMWLIREGTVELTVEGKSARIGPGSLGFVRSNEEHGIRNVGDAPATYFVVAIGPGAA
jgi:mannose-6-phosphate isomerase-like protein (cupin superfamily)